jgi:hypothetical protein
MYYVMEMDQAMYYITRYNPVSGHGQAQHKHKYKDKRKYKCHTVLINMTVLQLQ